MDKISITIATRNRFDKLVRCLESIPWDDDRVEVLVCCDNDYDTFERLKRSKLSQYLARLIVTHEHLGSPACHNILASYVDDGLLYLMDDMTIHPGALNVARKTFNALFPDDDGMLGLRQTGVNGAPSGVALLGKKFLSRYPDKKFHYSGYWHFADMEILALAQHLGRFYFEPDAKVHHYHPNGNQTERDKTHHEARAKKGEDFQLFKTRQEKGEIWGM